MRQHQVLRSLLPHPGALLHVGCEKGCNRTLLLLGLRLLGCCG